MRWSGAVLAGGKSSRFGRDKALHLFRGRPLMVWVAEGLGEASERFAVANTPYPGLGLPVYPDLRPGGDTLSGLHAALHHARHEWVAVAACDQPFLTGGFWQFLLSRTGPEVRAVAAGSGDFLEPLGALYHKSLEGEIARRLDAGQLRMQALLRETPHAALDKADLEARFGPHLFMNANRLEDLTPHE